MNPRCHPERRIASFAIRSRRTPTAKAAVPTGLSPATSTYPALKRWAIFFARPWRLCHDRSRSCLLAVVYRLATIHDQLFLCGERKTHTRGRTLRLFPFQAREAWTFPSTPSAPRISVRHRRRSHRYAIRPRRSETMNCHYMMRRAGRKPQQEDRGSAARGQGSVALLRESCG